MGKRMSNHIASGANRRTRRHWHIAVRIGDAKSTISDRGFQSAHDAAQAAAEVLETAIRNGFDVFVSIRLGAASPPASPTQEDVGP